MGAAFLSGRVEKHRWILLPYGVIIQLALGTTLSRTAWVGTAGDLLLFSVHKKFGIHNLFLNILADTGLAGLAAFIWFMGKVLTMVLFLWRYGDLFETGAVVTLAALFINELFSHNLYTVQTGGIIWFLLGALSMLYQERRLQLVS